MKLSDRCFLILDNFSFYSTINNIECDKNNLEIRKIFSNFNGFKLKNLTGIKFVGFNIDSNLEILLSSKKICSSLKTLDLSNINLTDKGIQILKSKIFNLKNIEVINFKNTKLTNKAKEFLNYFKDLKEKKLTNEAKLLYKSSYKILILGGWGCGKTSFCNLCQGNGFYEHTLTTCGIDYFRFKFKEGNFILYDTMSWGSSSISILEIFKIKANGIIILFDVTSSSDFEILNDIIKKIKVVYNVDKFPILLVANKIDLSRERVIYKKDIEKFQKDNKLIGYFEVSCKDNINIKESIDFIANYIINKEN